MALCFSILGCQSMNSFKIKTLSNGETHTIAVDRNRVIHECYFMNAEKENNWRHQYILYILNNENEAIPVFYPTNQGKSECTAHLKKVEKILRNQARVHLCVQKKLEKMSYQNPAKEYHDFGELGKHTSPFYALGFESICNSKECFSIREDGQNSCSKL